MWSLMITLNFSRLGSVLLLTYSVGVNVSILDTNSKYSVIEIQRDNKPTLTFRVEREMWDTGKEKDLDKILEQIINLVNER